jgi:hypothetical protein
MTAVAGGGGATGEVSEARGELVSAANPPVGGGSVEIGAPAGGAGTGVVSGVSMAGLPEGDDSLGQPDGVRAATPPIVRIGVTGCEPSSRTAAGKRREARSSGNK